MNLSRLRELFKEYTGRVDYADAPIDELINAGQRFLDDLTDFQHSKAAYYEILAAGDYMITFTTECQSILDVWLVDRFSDAKTQLEKVAYDDLRGYYSSDATLMQRSTPLYYTPVDVRPIPNNINPVAFANYIGYMDVATNSQSITGLIILPPADMEYMVEVKGRFYSPELAAGTATSWWSNNHPFLLAWAAAYLLEVSYRNTAGANDWLTAIERHLRLLDINVAEQEAAAIDRIRA